MHTPVRPYILNGNVHTHSTPTQTGYWDNIDNLDQELTLFVAANWTKFNDPELPNEYYWYNQVGLSMCISCVYIPMFTPMYIPMYTFLRTYLCTFFPIYTHPYIHTSLYTQTYTYNPICLFQYIHKPKYMHSYMFLYTVDWQVELGGALPCGEAPPC